MKSHSEVLDKVTEAIETNNCSFKDGKTFFNLHFSYGGRKFVSTGQSSLVVRVSVFGAGAQGIKPQPRQSKDFKIVIGSCYLPVMVVLLLTESSNSVSL